MKTNIRFFVFAFFCLLVNGIKAHGGMANAEWSFPDLPDLLNFELYRATESMVCTQDSWVIPPTVRAFDFPSPQNGIYFHTVVAVLETGKTDFSNEVLIYYCNDAHCPLAFTVEKFGIDSVYVDFEKPSSVTQYQVRYSLSSGGPVTIEDIPGSTYLYGLTPGIYTFTLFAKDALGRTIETQNPYQSVQIEITSAEPPEPPVIGAESLGAGTSQKLVVAFEMNDPFVTHYKLNGYSTSSARDQAMTTRASGDVIADAIVPYGATYCLNLPRDIVFLRATAVDENSSESESTASYRLMGDVLNTDFSGTPSQSAVIDMFDKAELTLEYKKYAVVKYPNWGTNYCTEYNLYDKMPLPSAVILDYNRDGNVGSWDVNYFRTIYGRTGAGK